jgi:hypothetical protein
VKQKITVMKKLLSVVMMMIAVGLIAQSNEKEERMKRDVEVAENVLSTLVRQQMERKNSFWGFEVKGSYTPGYGVTLRIPYDNWNYAVGVATTSPVVWDDGDRIGVGQSGGVTILNRSQAKEEFAAKEMTERDLKRLKEDKSAKRDSARNAYGDRLLEASKMFLADYGDLIGLEPNEKIMITTKSDRGNYNFSWSGDVKAPKKKVISVEAIKSDLTQFKQGKMSREQLLGRFKVVNSDVSDESAPDLELLSTILGRLYRSDLSKTFFTENTPYYERMKDFGVTFYMQVYSSNESGYKRWNMPTVDLQDVSQEERDKKVKELYPLFEKDIKENLLEYGRTLSSLKDEELLILDVTLTRCVSCGIPATVELSVKASVLKEYGSGKLSKEAAIAKINLKKGTPQ